MPPQISEIERKILDFMVQYLRENTYQPSIREIGQRFGIKSTKTVSEHLQALARKGFLERDPSRSRGVRILGVDLHPDTVSIPCFADFPHDRRADVAETFLTVDRRLAGTEGGFFVRVRGDHAAALGVRDGDYLLLQPVMAEELADGAIVVARLDGSAGFHRCRRNGEGASLHPVGREDGAGRPVEGLQRSLVGRVTALYRRMDMDGTVAPASFTTH